MIVGRLILRFLVVPLGALAAALAVLAVIMIAEWQAFVTYAESNPSPENFAFGALLVVYVLPAVGGTALAMLAPGAIGILIAEFFAIRSWIFHVLNGLVSTWVGRSMLGGGQQTADALFQDQRVVLVMGLCAGFAYWLVAGWSAGFWLPATRSTQPPAPPP